MGKRETGNYGEALVAEYLRKKRYILVGSQYRCRQGEIDLIGQHEGYLVFVEVKYRKTDRKGNALEAVNLPKQRQICKTADYYRYIHGLGAFTPVRYDVVALQGEEIRWIQNAFAHIYIR